VPAIEKALLIVGVSITMLAAMGMGLQAYSWRHVCWASHSTVVGIDQSAAAGPVCE
jgi:hypothetical protein